MREILESFPIPNIPKVSRGWRFQQDNSPIHTSQVTRRLFEARNIRVMDWPSNSPDLNPIENLWAILKKKVEKKVGIWLMKKKKLTITEFQAIIKQEWEGLDHDLYLKLSYSMKNHIDQVIEQEGKKCN